MRVLENSIRSRADDLFESTDGTDDIDTILDKAEELFNELVDVKTHLEKCLPPYYKIV
jgi:hypothetical protein